MSFLDRWQHRLRAVFRADNVRRERDEELEFHLSLDAMHAHHGGMTSQAAREHARRQFGNVTATKEVARSVSRSSLLDTLWQDMKYAERSLRRAPGYLVGASLILAIGIGATTSVFSIFDTVVRRGMPYPDAKNLWLAFEQRGTTANALRGPSYLTVRDWIADSTVWQSTVEGIAFVRGGPTWIDGADGADRVPVGSVTPGFFRTMGVAPFLGRTFLPDEETRGGNRVVVLSFDAWRRYYGGERSIIGRTVNVDSIPRTVIGVMPRGFAFPQWSGSRTGNTAMWAPIAHIETTDPSLMKRGDRADLRVVARVRADADSARAAKALSVVASRLAVVYPESKEWNAVGLVSVRNATLGSVQQLLTMLAGAVGLVLLLACANVANLTFVRVASRIRELSIRTALGAGRARVIRQLLTESVCVALVGCAGGIALASLVLTGVRRFAADQFPGAENLEMNVWSLLFAASVALVAAVASSLVPALRLSKGALGRVVRSSASATGSRGDMRIRSGLVVAQLTVALVLLVGTGLFTRSLRNAAAIPLGFDPTNLVATAITPPAKYAKAEDALALYQRAMDRARQIPGVVDVAFVNHAPLGFGGMPTTVTVEGRPVHDDIGASTAPLWRTVSANYLRTMKMEMASGRWFTEDDMRTRDGFVVNETLAHQLFPNESAVGKSLVGLRAARPRPDFGQPVHGVVLGVVKDIQTQGQGATQPEIFVPFTLEIWHWGTMVIRTTDVARTIPATREVLREIDPSIPEAKASSAFNGAGAMADRASAQFATRRLMLTTVGVFAGAALLLAAIGLYSVVSYGVSQRTREVGVRVALGATDRAIVRLIVGEGTRLAVLGTLLGLSFAYLGTRWIQTLLFNTPRMDVLTYAATAGILLVTAAFACYVPARRAARLSPVEAIRGE